MHLTTHRGRAALATTLILAAGLLSVPAATASPDRAAAGPGTRLTNLAHLDFLAAEVTPPTQAGHTTYRLASQPGIGVLWTYADRNADGSFRRLGGGTYDAATDTYGQGAFNADDISRAAVVYLRDWQQTKSTSSRDRARELLRGLTYMQTASGPNAGNVVLWMQPDGTLNRSADPVEQPDPSDSDASFWLARTLWALGEGYASFRGSDPAFARFLQDRLQLAARAVDRQSLDAYGRHFQVDGRSTPAWLIADGADATAEAVLGLAAYAHAGGDPASRRTLVRLSEGISELAGGNARHWPFGAVLPTPTSLSNWHAWASQMPGALSATADVTGQRSLRRTALRDAFTFMPWLLTSGGPDNGRAPSRTDGTQIAYGVDSRVQNLIALAGRSDDGSQNGARQLAGMTAAWFFGANAARQPAYDPATGVTIDGIAEDGTVNRNSGAESTIHGLLTMLALDAHPSVRRIASQSSEVQGVVGTQYVQAEDGTLGAGATAVAPKDLWTGEAQYDGSGYVQLADHGSETLALFAHPRSLVIPVVDLRPDSSARTAFSAGNRLLGAIRSDSIGPQGDSVAPGALLPRTLDKALPASADTVTVRATAAAGDVARLDAVLVQPLVSRLVLGSEAHGTALLRSAARRVKHAFVTLPGTGPARVLEYDGEGRLLARSSVRTADVRVRIAPGGVTLVRR